VKILLTGASSFTGFWMAKILAETGHHVVAPLRRPVADYSEDPRAERVRRLKEYAEVVGDCTFGSERFLELTTAGGYDLFCHHAARAADYRSPDFDISGALAENTRSLRDVLGKLATAGVKGVVYTGTVFEQNEGAGEAPLRAFSAYGVSKGLTATVVSYRCSEIGLPFHKFVIPNPFGPLEGRRFCSYLLGAWKAGNVAHVRTPDYVRDNIHVDLLALAYARFVGEVASSTAGRRLNPSGYVENQGSFARRVAAEMQPRLRLPCRLELAEQEDFSEPLMRVNTDSAAQYAEEWNEAKAWDGMAEAYR
jgi:UDP-glucose 4-epimerase